MIKEEQTPFKTTAIPTHTPPVPDSKSKWKRKTKNSILIPTPIGTIQGVPEKNDPTLRCHIYKSIEFEVFKFSTVI